VKVGLTLALDAQAGWVKERGMATKKLKVVVTRRLPDPVETRMRELFDAELNVEDKPFTAEQLADAVARAGDGSRRWPHSFARR
jgi:hypothetical protein